MNGVEGTNVKGTNVIKVTSVITFGHNCNKHIE